MGGGNPGTGFTCKPDVLRELAGKADTIGREIAGRASYTAEESAAASGAHEGWRLAAALDRAQPVWEQNMTGFGRQVSGVGDRLRRTATNYENADQRGVERHGG